MWCCWYIHRPSEVHQQQDKHLIYKHLEVDTGYISKPCAKTKVKRQADLLQEISNKTAESGQTDKVSYYQLKQKFILAH